MANLQRWWGYLHENGSVQAKRAWESTVEGDLEEASESPFVMHVIEPFYARDRQHALEVVKIESMAWLKKQK